MRGYDIDGVLTKKIKPIPPCVIVSGRTINEWSKTITQIGTDYPIYLRPYGRYGDHIMAGIWKSEMITRLGITEFYENEDRQINIIKRYCPNCKIVKV